MLGGRISNQDEDEVEDELDALQAEVIGGARSDELPSVPTAALPAKERAEARERERERLEEGRRPREAILA